MSWTRSAALFAALAAVTMALAGCERPKPPINGLAGFELARTTLAAVEPKSLNCHKSDHETRCWVDARQSIAGRVPQVELFFAGTEPGALLAQIYLEVPGCNLGELESWFEDKVGKPTQKSATHLAWAQKHIYLQIRNTGPARCLITALHPADTDRIDAIEELVDSTKS